MKLTHKAHNFIILDEVFEQESFDKIVKYFCGLDYAKNNKLEKVWRICDGEHYSSSTSYASKFPFGSPLDNIHHVIKYLTENHASEIVGKQNEDWSEITYRPYIYPSGSRISWHNDFGYTAACIFYCHKEWNPSWGGELMVANTIQHGDMPKVISPDNDLSRNSIKPTLDYYGYGNYISCLPNRMVFTRGKTWHMINRVDKDAGENLRCSFVAFFHEKK
jgi:hypothetical protein